MTCPSFPLGAFLLAAALLPFVSHEGSACEGPKAVREATPKEVRAYFQGKGMKVLTFFGFSGAGYEDGEAVLAQAAQVLARYDPKVTLVNIGGTADGIGAVYRTAKRMGFSTTGIVSTQAKKEKVELSPCVDTVFYVKDATWGGLLPGTKKLSPTSSAVVANSDVMVAFGGGEIARDELSAGRAAGKAVEFHPADMNHQAALDKAKKKGLPPPTDFRGAAATIF